MKLMFLHPVDYGRKAEELLWRKVYYEVIQLIKTNKKAGICGSGMRKSLSTQGVRPSEKCFGWISCGLNTGQESRLSFILVMALQAGNPHDLVRELPLQRIFQHILLNFWLPIFKRHVSPCRMMILRDFFSADCLIAGQFSQCSYSYFLKP